MPEHKGFSAWIVDSDGNKLPEFNVSINHDQVACWIPSVEGTTFSVHWSDHGGRVHTASYITLDSFTVPGRFLFGQGSASRSGVRVSPTSERPFMFKKVTSLEGNPSAPCRGAGTVTLHIKRVKMLHSAPANRFADIPATPMRPMPSLGGLQVGYGEETQTNLQSSTTWAVAPYSDDEAEESHQNQACGSTKEKKPRTFVSFVFRYRSYEFLLSQGIMTPGDVPASVRESVLRPVPTPIASSNTTSCQPSTSLPSHDIASYYSVQNGLPPFAQPEPFEPTLHHNSKRRIRDNGSRMNIGSFPSGTPLAHSRVQRRLSSNLKSRSTSWRGISTISTPRMGDGLELGDYDDWERGDQENGAVY